MGAPFSSDIRARFAGVHKVAIVFIIIQFIFCIVVLGLAATLSGITKDAQAALDAYNGPQSSSSEEEEKHIFELIDLVRRIANAYAVPLLLLQIGAVLALGFLKRGAIIAATVFQSLAIVYGIVMLVVPLLETAAFSAICSAANESGGVLTPFGEIVCGPMKHRFYAVSGVMGITVAISLVQSILGCIGAGQVSDAYKGFDRDKL